MRSAVCDNWVTCSLRPFPSLFDRVISVLVSSYFQLLRKKSVIEFCINLFHWEIKIGVYFQKLTELN